MSLVLDHRDFARTVLRVPVAPGPTSLVIDRGATLEGTVRSRGEPVEGVRVVARSYCLSSLSMGTREGVTDESGSFRIEHVHVHRGSLPPSSASGTLAVEDPSWSGATYTYYEDEEGALPRVDIALLAPGATPEPTKIDVGRDEERIARAKGDLWGEATLRIRFPEDAPVVTLVVSKIDEQPAHPARRDVMREQNYWEYRNHPAGRYRVVPFRRSSPFLPPVEFDVAPTGITDVVLAPGAIELVGTLVCDGRAVDDAPVTINGPMQVSARTDASGVFDIVGLAPGRYVAAIGMESHLQNEFDFDVTANENGECRVAFALPRTVVRGELRGFATLEGVVVQLTPRDGHPVGGNGVGRARVDEHGAFAFGSVPDGTYQLTLSGAPARIAPTFVRVESGRDPELVVLRPLENGCTVRGRVDGIEVPEDETDPRREAMASTLRLALNPLFGPERLVGSAGASARIAADGAFEIANVAPGDYCVVVALQGMVDHSLHDLGDLRVGDGDIDDLRLVALPGRQVHLAVDPGDPPSVRAVWWLNVPSGLRIPYSLLAGSNPSGLRAPPWRGELGAGDYTLEADFGDGRVVTRRFTVEPGLEPLEIVVARE
ncbi:MAG: carboxypeptidase-like regulatory domain-containing protein [Planctomycetota bacterium]